ncbi:asparagine synthase (glutamine-hydrolyzing) [Sphingomonas gei]|uniref:asparagine synthase (glutamine-hydrolyzing) n=1 Tax=Sphingomonas gei TaxID=1395960 RepID=A0A4S1X5W3_9SPHN|nr:asparagine synthase (glutamine-hydrolyzing) [Sphingomonas gei]TGX50370.1 asparagine synthase (glutamine-hydrolyzing) [Sphingomonas gei]
MCGIFGYFDRSRSSLGQDVLRNAGQAIEHRGPDDHGIFSAEGVALGNQRLSIIDVAGGHQPFVSDDGQIIVVQNGEIFNHVELAQELAQSGYPCRTHSDTETLLRLYEREGIDFLHRLNGMFAIAIFDRREGALYLARDRVGVKPLYVHDQGGRIVFGSEIKAMTPMIGGLPDLDVEALHHYLTFNYVPPPFTIRQGTRHLMPGTAMKVTRDATTTWRWWDLSEVAPEHGRPEADWIEEFNAILEDAVRLRMRSDVPFGAFLSGGVDSSSIVGLMARQRPEPIKTFCIGFDDPRYDESSFAQTAADRFATDHVMERVASDMLDLWPMAIYHCDQPHGDVSFLPTYRVSKLAAEHVKVVLTGDGGDELFAGYDKYRDFFAAPGVLESDDESFRRQYFDSISLFGHEKKLKLYRPATRASMSGVDSFDVARQWFDQVPHQDRINQALYLDTQLLLSGNNLVKPDRMGMAVSIEARTPFLDYRMMEFAFRMPGELKLRGGVTKYLYKKAVAPLIGEDLAYRKKQMFTVPVGDWFKGRLSGYCSSHIERLLQTSSHFEAAPVRKLLEDHVSGEANNTRELRAVIAVDHSINMASEAQVAA